MCNNKKMVTPNKPKQHYKNSSQKAKTPPRGGPQHSRKNTPSPSTSYFQHGADSFSFKTPPNNPNRKGEISRCASEPMRIKPNSQRRSVTPVKSGSPSMFAGPKCLEPPIPTSLPRPPTTWTRADCSARQALSFNDLAFGEDVSYGKKPCQIEIDPLSQQLKMLLKVA